MHEALAASDSSVEKGNLLEVHSGAKNLAKPMLFSSEQCPLRKVIVEAEPECERKYNNPVRILSGPKGKAARGALRAHGLNGFWRCGRGHIRRRVGGLVHGL